MATRESMVGLQTVKFILGTYSPHSRPPKSIVNMSLETPKSKEHRTPKVLRYLGKVDVDCRYRWKKAQWGVLDTTERPAGIVYMDITFKQPPGYWLQSVTVFVTLSQDATLNTRRQHKSSSA